MSQLLDMMQPGTEPTIDVAVYKIIHFNPTTEGSGVSAPPSRSLFWMQKIPWRRLPGQVFLSTSRCWPAIPSAGVLVTMNRVEPVIGDPFPR